MMKPIKLVVFMLDALCTLDLDQIRTLPNMGAILNRGSYVRHLEPIYPSLTYPCHVAVITGNTAKGHGIPHNEKVAVENPRAPWYNQRSDIQGDTIFDAARRAGKTSCALSWPVTGKADIDFNMPMIVPISYQGDDPYQFLAGNASQCLLDAYYWKYSRYLKGRERNLDLFTMALAPDILRDFGQPDLMFIKMCDLDTVRHQNGIDNDFVKAQLKKHDEEFAVIVEAVRRHGEFDQTAFVILGDHGQADIRRTINMNLLLRDHGFLRTDAGNRLIDYQAYCHSASMSGWIQLKDPGDAALREKVYRFLLALKDDPENPIGFVLTKEEAEKNYGLTGPLDFVVEGEEPTAFDATLAGVDLFTPYLKPGRYYSVASHGYLPERDETTTLFAAGAGIRSSVTIERTSIINVGPTLAALTGIELRDAEGSALKELLSES